MTQTAGGKNAPNSGGMARAAPLWRVQLLGGLRVVPLHAEAESQGEAFSRFRTHKTALLLARLLLQPNRSHSRDELVDWLWPDIPIERGRANLSQTLLYLRKQFAKGGGASFVSDHQSICVRAQDFETDVGRFEQKVREVRAFARMNPNAPPQDAAALWEAALSEWDGGELLSGFYDDWVENERTRLNELRQTAQANWQAAAAQAAAQAQNTILPVPAPQTAPPISASPDAATLPLTLTRFFGRDADLDRVCDLLTQNPPVRLVTLLGTGGIGKTRLAVEAARRLAENQTFAFAAFVSLADIAEPDHVPSTLARCLISQPDAAANRTDDPLQSVVRFLSDAANQTGGRVLLVLDNMEQFGGTCAPLVARLLTPVPQLTVLTTSRQPVGVAGEQEVMIGPLTAEKADPVGLPPDVRLFADRARLVRPDFAITPQNTDAVDKLCALLEGVPLALELAAAWSRALSPDQIAARLNNRFDLLKLRGVFGGDVPKRHQSLHAAIAWSYDLLPPSLQNFFAQLSVFRGGWTLHAAQVVTGVGDASEPLFLLAERSLILAEADQTTGELRYRMLESLREFADEQAELLGRDEYATLVLRHAQYFHELSQKANLLIETGRGMSSAFALVGAERDNLRAVFARLRDQTMEPAPMGDGAESVAAFVQAAVESVMHSHYLFPASETHSYLRLAADALVCLPDNTRLLLRAALLLVQGNHAMFGGDLSAAEHQLRESLALWSQLDRPEKVTAVHSILAGIAWRKNDHATAAVLWTQVLDYTRQVTHNPRHEAAMLNNLALCGGDLAQRREWIEQAVALDRTHSPGTHFLACSLTSMGAIALEQNDPKNAHACFEEAHAIAAADGATGMMGVSKIALAEFLLLADQALDRAETLLDEAQVLFETSGELPRVVEITRLRFHLALKRGDPTAALSHAREFLRVNRENALMDAEGLASARADMANQLRKAGFANQAVQLENFAV